MRRTEQDLWHAIKRADQGGVFTRIESAATVKGASDTTYKTAARHGWIELKTCRTRRDRAWVPDHPLSVEQLMWLAKHNEPRWRMYSYVLIGRYNSSNRFDAFALVSPVDATPFAVSALRGSHPRASWLVADTAVAIVEHLTQYGRRDR